MECTLTVPQSEFFADNNSEYVAAVAGFGSGKTEAAAVKVAARLLEYPDISQAYLAPTYSLIGDIFYPRIGEIFADSGVEARINYQKHNINFPGHKGILYCRTMDNPDRIVGWECGDAFMDEFDILPIDKAIKVMRKVSARCRQKYPDGKKNQKHITTTPEGFKATYSLFAKEPLPDSRLIQMSTWSNKDNLPDGYIEALIAQYPEELVKAYIEGEFVNLTSGTVYYSFDRELNNTHYVARPKEQLHIGMDFNVYKMCAIIHVIRDGIPYAVDEIIGERDTPSMIQTIQDKFPDHAIIVYPDASADNKSSKGASLSDIRLLKEYFYVDAPTSNPLIRNRVNSVNAKFCNAKGVRTYFVNIEKCPVYAMCLEQQAYDINGQPSKEGDVDHPVDAGGYFINRKWPVLSNFNTTFVARDFSNEVSDI